MTVGHCSHGSVGVGSWHLTLASPACGFGGCLVPYHEGKVRERKGKGCFSEAFTGQPGGSAHSLVLFTLSNSVVWLQTPSWQAENVRKPVSLGSTPGCILPFIPVHLNSRVPLVIVLCAVYVNDDSMDKFPV